MWNCGGYEDHREKKKALSDSRCKRIDDYRVNVYAFLFRVSMGFIFFSLFFGCTHCTLVSKLYIFI